jgi:hypothetical protein
MIQRDGYLLVADHVVVCADRGSTVLEVAVDLHVHPRIVARQDRPEDAPRLSDVRKQRAAEGKQGDERKQWRAARTASKISTAAPRATRDFRANGPGARARQLDDDGEGF